MPRVLACPGLQLLLTQKQREDSVFYQRDNERYRYRSLVLHPPRLCRIAVFSIKPTLLSQQRLMMLDARNAGRALSSAVKAGQLGIRSLRGGAAFLERAVLQQDGRWQLLCYTGQGHSRRCFRHCRV